MIQPIGNRLLIERVVEDAKTKIGEINVEDEDFRAPQALKAKVLACGAPEGTVGHLPVGTIIMVSQFAPTEVKEKPGDKFYIVPCEDVLGVVTPEKVVI